MMGSISTLVHYLLVIVILLATKLNPILTIPKSCKCCSQLIELLPFCFGLTILRRGVSALPSLRIVYSRICAAKSKNCVL